ncbi:phosphodiester glycosidase family protein [bacterium]|nr:phosphodiester glycosidase family protein [bacterium]
MPGFEYRTVPVRTYEKGQTPVMHQVRVSPKHYKFNLVLAKDYNMTLTTVSNLRKKIDALCAVNASFFDEHCQLLGYHSIGPRIVNPNIAQGNVLTGVLTLTPNYCNVWDRDSFASSQAEVAFQCGPRLIVDGQPTTGLHGAPARLSGAAIDAQQRVIMFATSASGRMTLSQCQSLLMQREEYGGVNSRYAINFDGGSSTGFSLATDALSLESPSMALIPSVLAVTKR